MTLSQSTGKYLC